MSETLKSVIEAAALVFSIYVAYGGLRLFWVAYSMHGGTFIRSREVLPDAPVPEALDPIDSEVRALGFVPTRLQRFRMAGQKQPMIAWGYHHPDLNIGLSIAEAQSRPPFTTALETHFPDGAAVVTWYPGGQSVDAPDFLGRFAQYSLQAAFDHQLLTQLRWSETHGDPLPIPQDDEENTAMGVAFSARHGRKMYARLIHQLIGNGIARLGFALLLYYFVSQVATGSLVSIIVVGVSPFDLRFLLLPAGLLLAVGGAGYASRGKQPEAIDADQAPAVDPSVHPLNRPERLV